MVEPKVIFVIMDDGGLAVFTSVQAVETRLEIIDVYNGEYQFFDGAGEPMKAVLDEPERTSILGLEIVGGGNLKGLEPLQDGSKLVHALSKVSYLEQNSHFSSLEDVRNHLSRD